MKYLAIAAVLMATTASAYAIDCFTMSPDAAFQRVSDTEVIATDAFNQKYTVTVMSCPELMDDFGPIVTVTDDDELCTTDVLRVEGDICPITDIEPVSN